MGIYHIRGYSGIWFLMKLCFRLELRAFYHHNLLYFVLSIQHLLFFIWYDQSIKNENLCEHEKHEYVWQKSIWYEETLLSKGNRVLITIRAIQHLFLSCVCTYVFENDKGKTIFPTAFSSSLSNMVQYFVWEWNSALEIVFELLFYLRILTNRNIDRKYDLCTFLIYCIYVLLTSISFYVMFLFI